MSKDEGIHLVEFLPLLTRVSRTTFVTFVSFFVLAINHESDIIVLWAVSMKKCLWAKA